MERGAGAPARKGFTARAAGVLLAGSLMAAGAVRAASAPPVPPGAWREPARYRLDYTVRFDRLEARPSSRVRVWVPYPADGRAQRVLASWVKGPWPTRLETDRLGNRMVYMEGRGRPDGPLRVRVVVERRPTRGLPATAVRLDGPDDPHRFLRPNRLIPLDGLIRQLADRLAARVADREAKIRAFYDYVVRNLRYSKQGTGWGRGDAVWACANKRGNCTDFHSLFIGLARSEGIPARFVIGFPVPPGRRGTIPGYHCWAEFYDPARGWRPVDASEAHKRGLPDAYFGALPNDRVQFTMGRDLTLAPPQDGPPLNYFIAPYAEVDGRVVPRKRLAFRVRFERLPLQTAAGS